MSKSKKRQQAERNQRRQPVVPAKGKKKAKRQGR